MKFKRSIILDICILSIIFISILPSYATGLKVLKYNHKKVIHLYFNHKAKVVDGKKKLVRCCDRRFYPRRLNFAFMKKKCRHGLMHN